jgi:hypothetical protein
MGKGLLGLTIAPALLLGAAFCILIIVAVRETYRDDSWDGMPES